MVKLRLQMNMQFIVHIDVCAFISLRARKREIERERENRNERVNEIESEMAHIRPALAT